MATIDGTTNQATEAWIGAHPFERSRATTSLVILSALWTGVVVWWTFSLWRMLADASPVLAMFEAENGGALTADEWLMHTEAREIFCAHEGADPSENRIGRFINADAAYGPVLALGGVVTAVTGAILASANAALSSQQHRRVALVMVGVFLVSLLPIMFYWNEIGALTQITE